MSSIKVLRHELKYSINETTMHNIRDKLKEVLKVDRNINGYNVRSLYFDSINDIDYQEKLEGALSRKKVRMRIYDPDTNYVKLELKMKHDTHQLKESLLIDRQTAEQIIDGNYDVLLNYKDEVAKKLYLIMRENCYIPKTIIEYKRIALWNVTVVFVSGSKIEEVVRKNDTLLIVLAIVLILVIILIIVYFKVIKGTAKDPFNKNKNVVYVTDVNNGYYPNNGMNQGMYPNQVNNQQGMYPNNQMMQNNNQYNQNNNNQNFF